MLGDVFTVIREIDTFINICSGGNASVLGGAMAAAFGGVLTLA
jgi:hypothetical protein